MPSAGEMGFGTALAYVPSVFTPAAVGHLTKGSAQLTCLPGGAFTTVLQAAGCGTCTARVVQASGSATFTAAGGGTRFCGRTAGIFGSTCPKDCVFGGGTLAAIIFAFTRLSSKS